MKEKFIMELITSVNIFHWGSDHSLDSIELEQSDSYPRRELIIEGCYFYKKETIEYLRNMKTKITLINCISDVEHPDRYSLDKDFIRNRKKTLVNKFAHK